MDKTLYYLPDHFVHMLPRRIRRFDPDEVTRVSTTEVAPEETGLSQKNMDTIWDAVVRFYRTGLSPSMALCVRRHGRVIMDRTIGHRCGNHPGASEEESLEISTPDTLYNVFSASKAVTATLVHMAIERGHFGLNDRVADFIPSFAQHGKGAVTISDLLTHRAGVALPPQHAMSLESLGDLDSIVEIICAMKPNSGGHKRLAYHTVTSGFLLADIIEKTDGRDLQTFLKEELRDPLGFENLAYGISEDRLSEVAEDAVTGPKARFPFTKIIRRALGADLPTAIGYANDPRYLTAVVPSGNIIASANEIGRFSELLLRGGELDGVRIFEPETLRRAVINQTKGELDRVMLVPVPYGFGYMVGGERFGMFGRGAPQAFGHMGFSNIMVWADPERDISVALLSTGKPFYTLEVLLWFKIIDVIVNEIPRDTINPLFNTGSAS